MSDTPRTDAAYAASTGAGIYELFKESQDIERELNTANKTNRLQYELITTAEKRGVDKSKEELNAANERIKRLEEVGNEMAAWLLDPRNLGGGSSMASQWYKAKEDKP